METTSQETSQKTENLNFGEALEALSKDQAVSRAGWNGKGMFLFRIHETRVPVYVYFNSPNNPKVLQDFLMKIAKDNPQDPSVNITSFIVMKAADNTLVYGWLASQTDMTATDWCIIDGGQADGK